MATKAKKPAIKVVVTQSTECFDFDAWAKRYVALVLQAEGYPVPSYEIAA